jgi:hypothetical protein
MVERNRRSLMRPRPFRPLARELRPFAADGLAGQSNGDTRTVEAVTELEDGDTIVELSPSEPSEPPVDEDGMG